MSGIYGLRFLAALLLCIAMGQLSAQIQTPPPPNPAEVVAGLKFLEAATSMSNTLTSWAYAMVAGSIIALLGTGYYRPASRRVRLAYLAFLPAWVFLYRSIQAGTKIQGHYLGELYSKNHKLLEHHLTEVNTAGLEQSELMRKGLICFGLWLVVYVFWWVFNSEPTKEKVK
jgi:hypothetical protein